MAKKPGNRGKTADQRRGSVRASFDALAALEALAWAQGGQLELPGLPAQRFAGVAPAPDDAGERQPGRPPGAKNQVPQAWREYLVAKYGSAIEGLAADATRPVAAIVAELGQAYTALCMALGWSAEASIPGPAMIAEWVTFAKSLQLQARRYVAPYQHSQAPQPVPSGGGDRRIAMVMFTGGKPTPEAAAAATETLGELLGFQPLSAGEPGELNASKLNAEDDGCA